MAEYQVEPNKKLTGADSEAILNALNKVAIISVTDNNGNIVHVNEKFTEISKYSYDELIGQNHRILKSGDQPHEMFVELWKTITAGKVWRGEIKNLAKDGSYYWVDTSIAPVLNQIGEPERYVSIRFLITEKKTLAEKFESQMETLEKMNKFMIDREFKMIELKEKVQELKNNSAEN